MALMVYMWWIRFQSLHLYGWTFGGEFCGAESLRVLPVSSAFCLCCVWSGDDGVCTVNLDEYSCRLDADDLVLRQCVVWLCMFPLSSLFSQYFVCGNQWCKSKKWTFVRKCAGIRMAGSLLSLFSYHSVLCGVVSVWLFGSGFGDFHVVFGCGQRSCGWTNQ